jgi:polyribonucleotide nucleotidyltransferase
MSDVECRGVSGGQGAAGRGRGRLLARIKANAAIGAKEEPAEETTVLTFPRGDMGRVIGKGGSTKKEIEEKCRAKLQVGRIFLSRPH